MVVCHNCHEDTDNFFVILLRDSGRIRIMCYYCITDIIRDWYEAMDKAVKDDHNTQICGVR